MQRVWLVERYPELVQYYSSNNIRPIEKITIASKYNATWICKQCGAEYQQTVLQRRKCSGMCRHCIYSSSNRQKEYLRLSATYNLGVCFPEISKEWHPDKNDPITPFDVLPRSGDKYWWKCSQCGHEWPASVSHRTTGRGCPRCSMRMPSIPEMAILFFLNLYNIPCVYQYSVDWLEDHKIDFYFPQHNIALEYDGEAWHKNPERDEHKNDVMIAHGLIPIRMREKICPPISNGQVIQVPTIYHKGERYVASLNEPIRIFLDILKIEHDPIDVGANMDGIIALRIKEFQKHSLAIQHSELLKEWDYELNQSISPYSIPSGSHQSVHWKCALGHKWLETPHTRTNMKTGCPYCSGRRAWPGFNDLASRYPELAKQWSSKNEKSPSEYTPYSNKSVYWICPICNYEWKLAIYLRVKGRQCPECRRNK